MATDLTFQILEVLSQAQDSVRSDDAFPSVPSETIDSELRRLSSRNMVIFEQKDDSGWFLTPEGEDIVANGSHEARVFEAVQKAVGGLTLTDLPANIPDLPVRGDDCMLLRDRKLMAINTNQAQTDGKKRDELLKFGKGQAFKAGWICKDKDKLKAKVESITDATREQLLIIQKTRTLPKDEKGQGISALAKRSLVIMRKARFYIISKGPKYSKEYIKEETDLTADMLASGEWKTVQLKPYNFQSKGALTMSGALHPLNKVRQEFRQIFFEMGFEEMPTNCYVETGFWNFDALFVPQQHPARDMQDTFFISDPAKADKPRGPQRQQQHLPNGSSASEVNSQKQSQDYEEYWDNVKETHENGKYGSIGYRYPWKEDESLRLVLRTHTTATSTYMLRQLAANPRPARYFSIDRVFRNESVDATHLAEFHQVEGVIADWDLSLGGLIGFMEVFFAKMGIHNLRFKPAYNPYTEPSLEIFSYHAGLGKWVEIGNSGMFRPEMLEPMGLPKDMRVYGWGLSLERPTMIKYGVKNIRELLGHKVELSFIESNPAVRLEKD